MNTEKRLVVLAALSAWLLDRDDSDEVPTKKPNVKALESHLSADAVEAGVSISADERNAVWSEYLENPDVIGSVDDVPSSVDDAPSSVDDVRYVASLVGIAEEQVLSFRSTASEVIVVTTNGRKLRGAK